MTPPYHAFLGYLPITCLLAPLTTPNYPEAPNPFSLFYPNLMYKSQFWWLAYDSSYLSLGPPMWRQVPRANKLLFVFLWLIHLWPVSFTGPQLESLRWVEERSFSTPHTEMKIISTQRNDTPQRLQFCCPVDHEPVLSLMQQSDASVFL